MKKKVGLLTVASGLLVVSIVGGSLAYFRADGDARNTISAGNLGVDLVVEDKDNSMVYEDNGFVVAGALPGDAYDYPVQAYNNGDFDSYVRITLTKYWEDQNGEKNFDADSSLIELINLDSENWIVDDSDENNEVVYCYYKHPLSSKEASSNVIDQIKVGNIESKDQNLYSNLQIKVDVEVDAIQKAAAEDAILAEWGLDVSFDEGGTMVSVEE